MSALKIGSQAPPFCLPAAQGGEVGLDDYHDRANLILFFAKGMACGFCRQKMSQLARGLPRFQALGTEILMVSPTPLGRGRFYAQNFQIPFPYLCDPEYRVFELYGMPMRPHSLLWKAAVLRHAIRLPQPENDFGPPKNGPAELIRVLNDDDLGFFIVDKRRIVRYANQGPYVVFQGTKPVGMPPIPSNEEIVAELERCRGPAAGSRSA